MKLRLWISDGYVASPEAIFALMKHDTGLPQRQRVIETLILTHPEPDYEAFAAADVAMAILEPADAKSYVCWALEFAAKHGVNMMCVGRHWLEMHAAEADFAKIGVTLMPALGDRASTALQTLSGLFEGIKNAGCEDLVPRSTRWKDDYRIALEGVSHLVDTTPASASALCAKPDDQTARQTLILLEDRDAEDQLYCPQKPSYSLTSFGQLACTAAMKIGKHQDWIIMQHIEGDDVEVDVVANEGGDIAFCARMELNKDCRRQVFIDNPDIQRLITAMVQTLGFRGLFSFKCRLTADKKIVLLNAKPTPSSGLCLSNQSGLNLLWMALRSSLNPDYLRGFEYKVPAGIKVGIRFSSARI